MPPKRNLPPAVKVVLTNKDSVLPVRVTSGSAGYDLVSPFDTTVLKGEVELVSLGLKMEIPPGYAGHIRSRSNFAKRGIDVCAGTIDSDYRGDVLVCFYNHSDADLKIRRGDRIAQVVISAVLETPMIQVEELGDTVRAEGGFGSTGK